MLYFSLFFTYCADLLDFWVNWKYVRTWAYIESTHQFCVHSIKYQIWTKWDAKTNHSKPNQTNWANGKSQMLRAQSIPQKKRKEKNSRKNVIEYVIFCIHRSGRHSFYEHITVFYFRRFLTFYFTCVFIFYLWNEICFFPCINICAWWLLACLLGWLFVCLYRVAMSFIIKRAF